MKREEWAKLPVGVRLTLERLYATDVFFWMPTIALAFPAFLCGVIAAHESIRWTFGVCVVLFLVERYAILILLEAPLGFIMYYFSFHPWLACLFLGLSLNFWLEIRCRYLHTRKQVNDLLSDLLAPGSPYSFEELQVPSNLVEGFFTYQIKQGLSRLIRLPDDRPVRVFRFQPSDQEKSTNAAVSFPVENYPSLIFVRVRFEDLTHGQLLQLYHELAHGTTEGTMMITRGLRWKTLAPFGFLLFCALSALCFSATHGWHRWLSLGLLIAASWFRRRGAKFIAEWNSTENEILADSIALAHQDFEANEKWKKLAESLAKRLEDEAKLITKGDPKYFTITERACYLRKYLKSGRILLAELPQDLDPRLFLAFAFYVLSGYYASLPNAYAGITFQTLLVLVPLSWLLILFNLLQTSWWLTRLRTALDEKLKARA